MAETESLYVKDDTDLTKSDIKDRIRDHRDEIPELQEVSLAQNKTPLIEDLNEALEAYATRAASISDDEVMETQEGGAAAQEPDTTDEVSGDVSGEDTAEESTFSPGKVNADPLSVGPRVQ